MALSLTSMMDQILQMRYVLHIDHDGVPGPPAGFSDETEVCIQILNRVPVDDGEEYNILEGEVLTCDLTNGLLVNSEDLILKIF